MFDLEKLRKQTRKNWKRETRAKYRYLMDFAKQEIENATSNSCYIERHPSKGDYFALWLVKKKLERNGFKCRLEMGKFTCSGVFYYDTLYIKWE